jgi:hypothetical protein
MVIARSLSSPQQEPLPFPNGTAVTDEAFQGVSAIILAGGPEQSEVIYPGGMVRTRPNTCLRKVGAEMLEPITATPAPVISGSTADPILAKYAAEIHRLGKRVKEDVIKIGHVLHEAQEHAGRGAWHLWINAEFGWSDQTAYRFIHVYQAQLNSEFHKLWNSDLPLSALYQLAAPKTPDRARKEIVERIEDGEEISVAKVTEAIAEAKAENNLTGEIDINAHRARMVAVAIEDATNFMIDGRFGEHGADHDHDRAGELTGGDDDHDAGDEYVDHGDHGEHGEHGDHGGGEHAAGEHDVHGGGGLLNPDGIEQRAAASAAPAPAPRARVSKKTADSDDALIRGVVLDEYFAVASGTDIFGRIPLDRRDEVIRSFLDTIGVDGMRTAMSEAFGQEARRKLAAPAEVKKSAKKSAKKWTKSINHRPTNSARNGRGQHSRQ